MRNISTYGMVKTESKSLICHKPQQSRSTPIVRKLRWDFPNCPAPLYVKNIQVYKKISIIQKNIQFDDVTGHPLNRNIVLFYLMEEARSITLRYIIVFCFLKFVYKQLEIHLVLIINVYNTHPF